MIPAIRSDSAFSAKAVTLCTNSVFTVTRAAVLRNETHRIDRHASTFCGTSRGNATRTTRPLSPYKTVSIARLDCRFDCENPRLRSTNWSALRLIGRSRN